MQTDVLQQVKHHMFRSFPQVAEDEDDRGGSEGGREDGGGGEDVDVDERPGVSPADEGDGVGEVSRTVHGNIRITSYCTFATFLIMIGNDMLVQRSGLILSEPK